MLKKLLGLVSFPGERQLAEDKAVINKNIILAKSPDGTIAIKVALKEELFDKTIGINVKKTLDYINLFKEYEIKIKDNRLIISKGKKKISILLTEPALVKSVIEESKFNALKENLKGGTEYIINVDSLKEILSKYFALGEPIVKCNFEDKELDLEIGNNNTDNIKDKFEIEGKGKVSNIKLGQAFLDGLSVLEGEVNLKTKENMPILITQETKEYSIELLIAQIG
jgi:hypothetical protein